MGPIGVASFVNARLGIVMWALAFGTNAIAVTPTCEELVAALPAALRDAREFVVAVTVEQSGREIAFERTRVVRRADGSTTTTVLERRGLRRPDGTGGAPTGGADFVLPCDGHVLDVDGTGRALLRLRDPAPGATVTEWALRFDAVDGRWQPVELVAPFTLRVLLVPVRGRFVTVFDAWRFDEP